MQLRESSERRRPGRYLEDGGPLFAEVPSFVHDDVAFNEKLGAQCAFPSLPMNHPGPGPSETWKEQARKEQARKEQSAREARAAAASKAKAKSRARASAASAAAQSRQYMDDQQESETENEIEIDTNSDTQSTCDDNDDDDDDDSISTCSEPAQKTIPSERRDRLIFNVLDMTKLGRTPHNRQLASLTLRKPNAIPTDKPPGSHAEAAAAAQLHLLWDRRPKSPTQPGVRDLSMQGPPEIQLLRQAYIGKSVSMRQPGQAAPSTTSGSTAGGGTRRSVSARPHPRHPVFAFDSSSDVLSVQTETRSDVDESFKLRDLSLATPNWPELPDGIKFLIVYELTQDGLSFTRAAATLDLDFNDVVELIDLVTRERAKALKYNRDLEQFQHWPFDNSWLEEYLSVPRPSLVTDVITRKDIQRGKAFLNFMGFGDVAERLEGYLGVGGDVYDIPLNHFKEDGFRSLIPHFNVGCREELLEMFEAHKRRQRERPRGMSAGELLVRMDAPPGTINPRRCDPHFQPYNPSTYGNPVPAEDLAKGLYPTNYLPCVPWGNTLNTVLLVNSSNWSRASPPGPGLPANLAPANPEPSGPQAAANQRLQQATERAQEVIKELNGLGQRMDLDDSLGSQRGKQLEGNQTSDAQSTPVRGPARVANTDVSVQPSSMEVSISGEVPRRQIPNQGPSNLQLSGHEPKAPEKVLRDPVLEAKSPPIQNFSAALESTVNHYLTKYNYSPMGLRKNGTPNRRAQSEVYSVISTPERFEPSELVVGQKKRRTTFDDEDDDYIDEEEETPRGSRKNRGATPRKPGRKKNTFTPEDTPVHKAIRAIKERSAGGSVRQQVSPNLAANSSINVAQETSIVVASPTVGTTTNSPPVGQATGTPKSAVKKTVKFVKKASSIGSGSRSSGPVVGSTKPADSGLPKGNAATSNVNSGSLVGLAIQSSAPESQLAQPIQRLADSVSLPSPGVLGHAAPEKPNERFSNAFRETDPTTSSEIVARVPDKAPEIQQVADTTSITVSTSTLSATAAPEMATRSGEERLPEPPGASEVPVKKSRGRPRKKVAEPANTPGAAPSELPSGSPPESRGTSETPEPNKALLSNTVDKQNPPLTGYEKPQMARQAGDMPPVTSIPKLAPVLELAEKGAVQSEPAEAPTQPPAPEALKGMLWLFLRRSRVYLVRLDLLNLQLNFLLDLLRNMLLGLLHKLLLDLSLNVLLNRLLSLLHKLLLDLSLNVLLNLWLNPLPGLLLNLLLNGLLNRPLNRLLNSVLNCLLKQLLGSLLNFLLSTLLSALINQLLDQLLKYRLTLLLNQLVTLLLNLLLDLRLKLLPNLLVNRLVNRLLSLLLSLLLSMLLKCLLNLLLNLFLSLLHNLLLGRLDRLLNLPLSPLLNRPLNLRLNRLLNRLLGLLLNFLLDRLDRLLNCLDRLLNRLIDLLPNLLPNSLLNFLPSPLLNLLLDLRPNLLSNIRESELRQARIAHQFMSELGRRLEDLPISPSIAASPSVSSLDATPFAASVQKPVPDRPSPVTPMTGHPVAQANVPFQLPLPNVKSMTDQQQKETFSSRGSPNLHQSSHFDQHDFPKFNNHAGSGFGFGAMHSPIDSPTLATSDSRVNEQIPLDPALFSNPTPPTDFNLTSTAHNGIQQQGAVSMGESLSFPDATSGLQFMSPPSSSPTNSSAVGFGINQPQLDYTWAPGAAMQQAAPKPTPASKKRKKSQQGSEPAEDGKPVKKPRSRKKAPVVESQQGRPSSFPPAFDQAPLPGPSEAQKNEALPKEQAATQKAQAPETAAVKNSTNGLHAPEP
ncbi:hypothetical protein B0T19DRAFT_402895 [Cercophora scortea]|uniref:Uncharacterized protein n=1 Tax=Cercophora scortea TaxID=314031 RepID=A0AAE0IHZ6_9PEZI|nr:hypothetical protein B0T19DRAFT_402895 [Cercophora scortea]